MDVAQLTVESSIATSSKGCRLPSLADVCNSPNEYLHIIDVALLNILCASGLPGAEDLEIDRLLGWLDKVAQQIKLETERNYYKFADNPAVFEFSQAKFCMVCLVTVLQRQCGVKYNPKWQNLTPDQNTPQDFGIDARDVFIHAIIDGIGGTCGSLPVLYVAVGRRLGYPLKLVKAAQHLFVRWDDPNGSQWFHSEQFNVEATGPGIHFLPDEHYRTWPRDIFDEDVENGIFLKSLSPKEELAEFVATRGYCLRSNGKIPEAIEALTTALQLAPHNRYFAASLKKLQIWMMLQQQDDVGVLNAPPRAAQEPSHGPFWVKGLGGQAILVQIPTAGSPPSATMPNLGRLVIKQTIQLPSGQFANAYLPLHGAGPPLNAEWMRLNDGRFALVHKPANGAAPNLSAFSPFEPTMNGQPILPKTDPMGMIWTSSGHGFGLPDNNHHFLLNQIQHIIQNQSSRPSSQQIPHLQPFALPPGPAVPYLPAPAKNRPSLT